jgi:hypothetical protein
VAAFRAFNQPRAAKAAFNLLLVPLPGDRTQLRTETRVACVDGAARRRFRLYWMLIKPFSGLIRRSLLRGIRMRAEALALARGSD